MNPLNAFVERARSVNPSMKVAQLVQLVRAQVERPCPGYAFSQLHIDVARNATDDFNPFHDSEKWQRIRGNPFGGPIALGFQLETLMAESVECQRREEMEEFPFARYNFTFAGVVRPDERVSVEIRPARRKEGSRVSNRVILRKEGRAVVMGQAQAMGRRPESLCLPPDIPRDLEDRPDRSRILEGRYFLKRKLLQVSDAKNLLSASQVSTHRYFDELEERALFPDLFPVSLISSALLEKATSEGHDFLAEPMVYTAHAFSVDRALLRQAVSGECLSILVEGPETETAKAGRDGETSPRSLYRCWGLLSGTRLLFQAEARLASLRDLKRVPEQGV